MSDQVRNPEDRFSHDAAHIEVFLFVSFAGSIFNKNECWIEGEKRKGSKYLNMSRVMSKPTFRICENKDADQLRGNREADQRLCFRYIDSIIPLLSKSKISSL